MARIVKFTSTDRKQQIRNLTEKELDVLVIGGGMTGAGIALDSASRKLTTGLIDKQDFAAGTSSRSTKLVHGGLRYLEHLELGLVAKIGREREIVFSNAPHIVIPEKMILPIVKGGSLGEFTTSLALYVYDHLAGVKKSEQRKMLSVKKTLKKEPLLNQEILEGGALYYEYKTNDARLTVECLKKSAEYGTTALNYCEAKEFIYKDKKVVGVKCIDLQSNTEFEIYAKHIVNATGVWVDQLREKDKSLKKKRLHVTKGIHIVVSKERFPLRHAIYFDVGDERMIFAIPKGNIVYIGTTDTNYTNNLENPDVTKEDVNYLIEAVNRIAPTITLKPEDVETCWSGLRPLIHEDGKAPSELSRKDEIFYSDSGLISIAGGKLTGYRLMAKNVMNVIRKRIEQETGHKIRKCKTENIPLAGGEFLFEPTMGNLMEYNDKKYDEAKQTGISIDKFKSLFFRYGMNIDFLIEKAYDFFNELASEKLELETRSRYAWLKTECWYTINYEMASTLSDFFIRRTGMIHFEVRDILKVIDKAADYFAEMLAWTPEQKQQSIDEFMTEYNQATHFAAKS